MRGKVCAHAISVTWIKKPDHVKMCFSKAAGDVGQEVRQHEIADPATNRPCPFLLLMAGNGGQSVYLTGSDAADHRRPSDIAEIPIRGCADQPIPRELIVAADLRSPEPPATAGCRRQARGGSIIQT